MPHTPMRTGPHARIVWRPSPEHLSRSRLAAFMKRSGAQTLAELHRLSVEQPDWFWPAVVHDLEIPLRGDARQVRDASRGHAFPQWFPEARINVADSLQRFAGDPLKRDQEAIVYAADDGRRRSLTYAGLTDEADRFAAGLLRLGVGKGDRIALFMPPLPQAAAAIFGAAKIGAIVVPAFSGYGADALAERLRASEAKVLVTVDGTTRRGQPVPMQQTAALALKDCETVSHMVVIDNSTSRTPMDAPRAVAWQALLDEATPEDIARSPEPLDPNHPLFIIYTSGTTGKPKGIVHSHLGFLLKTALDAGYAFDLQPGDVLGWIADLGWMLGPLMIVGGLHCGAKIVLIEGLPNHPTEQRLWNLVRENGITVMGVSPSAVRMLKSWVDVQQARADIASLRAFASTGEPWDEPAWWWLFDEVGQQRLPILNYSGGTEIGGGIVSCYTIAPIAPMAFSAPLPGMNVAVLDESGSAASGVGELCILNCWPGMAHGFWGDEARYLETYFSAFPNVWRHGDLASVSASGFWYLHGRSDDTLKIGGRRIGPAEIETVMLECAGAIEVAVVGIPDAIKGQQIAAFVVAADSATDAGTLAAHVASKLGKGFVPARIEFVSELPKTKNGKVMRRLIRARYLGETLGDLTALDAMAAVEAIPVAASRPSDRD